MVKFADLGNENFKGSAINISFWESPSKQKPNDIPGIDNNTYTNFRKPCHEKPIMVATTLSSNQFAVSEVVAATARGRVFH